VPTRKVRLLPAPRWLVGAEHSAADLPPGRITPAGPPSGARAAGIGPAGAPFRETDSGPVEWLCACCARPVQRSGAPLPAATGEVRLFVTVRFRCRRLSMDRLVLSAPSSTVRRPGHRPPMRPSMLTVQQAPRCAIMCLAQFLPPGSLSAQSWNPDADPTNPSSNSQTMPPEHSRSPSSHFTSIVPHHRSLHSQTIVSFGN
jgi:hypothetical protein